MSWLVLLRKLCAARNLGSLIEGRMSLYEVLWLTPSATDAEIKANYKRLATAFHPDKHTQGELQESASRGFRNLEGAYRVLSNKITRALYDVYGFAGLKVYESNKQYFEDIDKDSLDAAAKAVKRFKTVKLMDENAKVFEQISSQNIKIIFNVVSYLSKVSAGLGARTRPYGRIQSLHYNAGINITKGYSTGINLDTSSPAALPVVYLGTGFGWRFITQNLYFTVNKELTSLGSGELEMSKFKIGNISYKLSFSFEDWIPSLMLKQIYSTENFYAQLYQRLGVTGITFGVAGSKVIELTDNLTYKTMVKSDFQGYNSENELTYGLTSNVDWSFKMKSWGNWESFFPLEYSSKLKYKSSDSNFKLSMGAFYKYDGTVGIKPAMEISNFGVSAPITLSMSHNRHLGMQIAAGVMALVGLIFYKWSDSSEKSGSDKSQSSAAKGSRSENAESVARNNHQLQEVRRQNYMLGCETASKSESGQLSVREARILADLSRPAGPTNRLTILAAFTRDRAAPSGHKHSLWNVLTVFAAERGKPAKVSQLRALERTEGEVSVGVDLREVAKTESGRRAVGGLLAELHGLNPGVMCVSTAVHSAVFLAKLHTNTNALQPLAMYSVWIEGDKWGLGCGSVLCVDTHFGMLAFSLCVQ